MKHRLVALFLDADTGAKPVLTAEDRQDLEIVASVVVDADRTFTRLGALKSARARNDQQFLLTNMISANFDSICHVKWCLECMIEGCRLDRSVPLPKSLTSLYQEHSALFQRICTPGGDDSARGNQLLRILQLELIWCGQFL